MVVVMDHHIFSMFSSRVPEISLDSEGFDSWTNQGVAVPPSVDSGTPTIPEWLTHTSLKSPWLYVEKSTPNSHIGFTDIGDTRFVSVGDSCNPISNDHPSIILNRTAGKVHVTLEEVSNNLHPKTLWDSYFSLKNSAPGGNGIKISSYQKAKGGEVADFLPFCFQKLSDVTDSKYKLTVESLGDSNDVSIVPFKDVVILRPRPLCDLPIGMF